MSKIRKILIQLGVPSLCLCVLKRVYYKFLNFKFKFNPWHASAPYECRPYKRDVVRLANSVRPSYTLEIGCGLGEIISRVDGVHRLGMDIEQEVIDAAHFIYGEKCSFAVGSVSDVSSIVHFEQSLDLLIMINWTHELVWCDLSASVLKIIDVFGVKYILIDGIIPGSAGYPHYHGANEFMNWGLIVREEFASDGVRKLFLISARDSVVVSNAFL